jgi:hypothetical protein
VSNEDGGSAGPIDFGYWVDSSPKYGRNSRFVGAPTTDPGGRCANCGKLASLSKNCIVSMACYDGEWTCSKKCAEELDEFGCPLERSAQREQRD